MCLPLVGSRLYEWHDQEKRLDMGRPSHGSRLCGPNNSAAESVSHCDQAALVSCRVVALLRKAELITQTWKDSAADVQWTDALYPLAQEAMRRGYYMPNRNSIHCSRHSKADTGQGNVSERSAPSTKRSAAALETQTERPIFIAWCVFILV